MSKRMLGLIAAIWGFTGLSILLGWAILRLSPYMMELISLDMDWYQRTLLLANIVFMAYSAGYRGFHKNAAPRAAARIKHIYLTKP